MSETYQQKEYELKESIDNINSIPYIFENYLEEVNSYIDKLLDETKEINSLRNIIKEVREYIESYNLPKDLSCLGEAPISIRELRHILEILDKAGKDNE